MEVSDVKKRIHETMDRARRTATERRALVDEATREYQVFLDRVAVPLFRQIANILRAEKHLYTVFTPGGSVRLMSDRSNDDYIELSLDTTNLRPQVIVHSSRSRGRRMTESEITVGQEGPVRELTEEDVLSVVLKELEPMLER
jgi:hypothetical protein